MNGRPVIPLLSLAIVSALAAAAPQALAETVVAVTQQSYDSMERPRCTAIRMNPATFAALPADACTLGTAGSQGADRVSANVYDAAGQVIQIRRAVGTPREQAYATYSYTVAGRQEFLIDASGNRSKQEYDGFGRQVKWIFPSSSLPAAFNPATQATTLGTAGALNAADFEQYGYDANGNRTSLRKRDGSVIGYGYDALDRVTSKDIPATTTADVYYGYDLRGLEIFARFGSVSGLGITTSYDIFGRVATSTNSSDGITRALTYTYDAAGGRLSVTHPDGARITYGYDGLHRVTTLCETTTPCTVASSPIVSYSFDNQGRLQTLTRGASAATTAYTYDAISRVQAIAHNLDGVGTTNDVTFGPYAYNPASQITSLTIGNDKYVQTPPASTLVYTPNGLNQYGTIAGASAITPTYDANGNLTSDGTGTYGYDVENRLTSVTRASGTATLLYDPKGRLLQVGSGASATHYLYDGDALVAEYNDAGALLARYAHGPGADVPLVWYASSLLGAGSRFYLYANHQGSVVAVSNSAGAMTRINTYDAYGAPPNPNTNGGTFQYTGQAWLPQVGLYYYKARMYSPQWGRFLQTDPIGYKEDLNLYTYVGDDPLNGVDPFGLSACPPNDPTCIDDPKRNPDAKPDVVPLEQQQLEVVVVTARKDRIMSDGTRIELGRTDDEQGFRVSVDGMYPRPITRKGTQRCDDGSERRAGALNVAGLAAGESAGHTHPSGASGNLSGLPGPEDGRVAAASGKSAYVVSSRGAFAVDSTSAGFRVRQLAGGRLSGGERQEVRDQVQAWNQNNGGSGRTCTFTPD